MYMTIIMLQLNKEITYWLRGKVVEITKGICSLVCAQNHIHVLDLYEVTIFPRIPTVPVTENIWRLFF
jgi:hypothetical protein